MRSKESEQKVSLTIGIEPILTKADQVCPCARSRLIWTNIKVGTQMSSPIRWQDCLSPGWQPAQVGFATSIIFGTFLRPFEPGRPSEYPASFHRLPLSSYDRHGLVQRMDIPTEILSKVNALLESVSNSSGDSRDPASSSFATRRSLCEFIHLDGGDQYIRPLSAAERLRCLGFTSFSAPEFTEPLSISFHHLCATGNTFAVPVFRGLLAVLVSDIKTGGRLQIERLNISVTDRKSALKSLGSIEQVNRSR